MICCECGHEMRLTNEPMRETYRGEEIVVDGIERWSCDDCGNYVVPLEQADRLSRSLADAYAEEHHLLSPGEVRSARRELGMTQKEFESMLGVSSPSASRWESGKVAQSKPVDLLIRVARDVIGAAEYLIGETAGKVASARVPSADTGYKRFDGRWSCATKREDPADGATLREGDWRMAA